uniref:Programmed cell death 7 n=1 Tax=Salarias fasciatus TaxID=181472 RepID=A0A672F9Z4_SALFA
MTTVPLPPHTRAPPASGMDAGYTPGPPPDHTAYLWPPAVYDDQAFGHPAQSAGGPGPRGAPYAFSHSVPYASAPGPFSGNPYCSAGALQAFSGPFSSGPASYGPGSVSDAWLQLGDRPPGDTEDERAAQRLQDTRWLRRFSRSRPPHSSRRRPHRSIPAFREALHQTARLVRQLDGCCDTLKRRPPSGGQRDEASGLAVLLLRQLRDRAPGLRASAGAAGRRRTLRLRARTQRLLRRRQAEERRSEREAAISAWRMKRIHEVEEKKKVREKELKLAADAVLCEVRKKQADLKRMQDVLRSLQKLRSLRKEAAFRRGISTEQQCDGQFSIRLEELKSTMKRRAVLYSAEEKALMVMLEGEQEGERQRERDRRVRKETEQQLQRRRSAQCILFGGNALIIAHSCGRQEWDVFLVASDHPNGSTVPGGWIFPEPPSDEAWASALQPAQSGRPPEECVSHCN